MKKTYKIDVDCANCANKMEEAAKNTAGVKDATVNFISTSELGNVDKISKSSLLYSYNDYYYLIFNDVNVKYPNLRSFYSAITEFGTYIEYSDALAAKLHETATLIIKNHVVKVATKYFVK